MAFFKFRKGGDEHPAPPVAPESVPAMRKRARHRLIGAAVLVLAGVIGFPLLFDNQPRPIAVDIPIEIPDRNKVKPLGNVPVVPPSAQTSGVIDERTPPVLASASASTAVAVPKPVAPAVQASKPQVKTEAKTEAKAEPKSVPEKPVAASASRFVVQVGAFAEVVKAREARMKLERAGLKTYTQVVQTADGKRIRVRVGPFESKAQADKAAEKIKKLNLPAAILEL